MSVTDYVMKASLAVICLSLHCGLVVSVIAGKWIAAQCMEGRCGRTV